MNTRTYIHAIVALKWMSIVTINALFLVVIINRYSDPLVDLPILWPLWTLFFRTREELLLVLSITLAGWLLFSLNAPVKARARVSSHEMEAMSGAAVLTLSCWAAVVLFGASVIVLDVSGSWINLMYYEDIGGPDDINTIGMSPRGWPTALLGLICFIVTFLGIRRMRSAAVGVLPNTVVICIGISVCGIVVGGVGKLRMTVFDRNYFPGYVAMLCGGMGLCWGSGFVSLWGCRTLANRWIANVRRARMHCVECGYNLRGCVSDLCPECGCATESLGKGDCDMGP